jgi:signal transduction histidine kinase
MDPRRAQRTRRLLVVALVTVWAGFLVDNAIMFWATRADRWEAHDLLTNAVPSIESLQGVNDVLRELDGCLAASSVAGPALACLQKVRPALDPPLTRYETLPTYPGEAELAGFARRTVAAMDRRIAEFASASSGGDAVRVERARRELSATIGLAHRTAGQLTILNGTWAGKQAAAIAARQRRSAALEFCFDFLSILIATAATLFALSAARRYNRWMEERTRELELFAERVAHDLMSPLATVGLALSLERERRPDDRQSQRAIDRALSSLRRVRLLVDGLLDFARAGAAPAGARSDVRALLDDLVPELQQLAEQARVELVVERCEPLTVRCSPGVLTSILSNLARNAIQHMGDSEPRRVTVRAIARAPTVSFEVEDTGPGIPPKSQELIFEPYTRIGSKGTGGFGIGLATVKRLVTAHGGRVGVRSGPGRGALFWFELPRCDPAEPDPACVARRA